MNGDGSEVDMDLGGGCGDSGCGDSEEHQECTVPG